MNANSNLALKEKNEKVIIYFKDGIYGFEDIKEYILLQEDDSKTIWSLRAAHSSSPSLIVLNPYMIMDEYEPVLPPEELSCIGNPDAGDLCFLSVAALKENMEDSVVNLKSPLVINVKTRQAKQVILENNDYPLRFKLFPCRK